MVDSFPGANEPASSYEELLRSLAGVFDSEKTGRVPFSRKDYSLEPLRCFLEERDALRTAPLVFHIGGTNGKGSTCAWLTQLLLAQGLSVGTFTSPHLVSYRERIRQNGQAIPEQDFVRWMQEVLHSKPDPGGSPMRSVFEALTATAALFFKEREVDAVVLEVGLGGRLDATNVFESDLSLILPIDRDHTEVLGDSIQEIAAEKAGILRPKQPLFLAEQLHPKAREVLLNRARELACPIYEEKKAFSWQESSQGVEVRLPEGEMAGPFHLSCSGLVQRKNLALALAALHSVVPLKKKGGQVREAIERFVVPGRLQSIGLPGGGSLWLDGGHNPGAAKNAALELHSLCPEPRALLLGISANKDVDAILPDLVNLGSPVLICRFSGPRSSHPERLREKAQAWTNSPVLVFSSVLEAWRHWQNLQEDTPHLIVTGSFFLVGELMSILHQEGIVQLDPPPDPRFS